MPLPDPTLPPRRLVLFAPGTSARYRRIRLGVALVLFLLGLCVIAPVYPVFSTTEPYVLGFPMSFAWVIGALVLSFLAVLFLFFSEDRAGGR